VNHHNLRFLTIVLFIAGCAKDDPPPPRPAPVASVREVPTLTVPEPPADQRKQMSAVGGAAP
jgi:hypothetical protein